MTNYPNKFFKDMYLDYVNNYVSTGVFAEDNGWSIEEAKAIIDLGREKYTQHNNNVSNKERYDVLMAKYYELKDEIMEHDESFHDAMYFDIEGYRQERDIDAELLENLETQVDAFEHILAGYKKINYEYS
jgi:hypothetical protein